MSKKPKKKPRPSSQTRRKRDDKRKRFLVEYRKTGNIKASAEHAMVNRCTVYEWQKEDPKFAAAMTVALDEYVDTLETEADRRAVEGVEEPVFYKGRRCGFVNKYSDTLLMFRLNGLRPEKYKRVERRELTGKDGRPLTTMPAKFDLSKLTKEQLEQLDDILAIAEQPPES